MNTNMKELSFEEMEMVNGGWSWNRVISGSCFGGIVGMLGAGIVVASMATPAGWLVAGAGLATFAAGVGAGTGVAAVVSAIVD